MANKKIKVQLSLDEEFVQIIDEYADKYNLSRSGVVSMALRDMDEAKSHPEDQDKDQQLIKQLNDYLIKQKRMIEGELKYFGKTSRDLTQTNLIYGHILNSMLWKMNCSDRDFIAQNSNSNPVFSRSIDQAVVQIKALRQKKMSADKKYQDKAMSNGTK